MLREIEGRENLWGHSANLVVDGNSRKVSALYRIDGKTITCLGVKVDGDK